jgi:hypothetical protein
MLASAGAAAILDEPETAGAANLSEDQTFEIDGWFA